MYVSSDEGEYAVQAFRASKAVTRIKKRTEKGGEVCQSTFQDKAIIDANAVSDNVAAGERAKILG